MIHKKKYVWALGLICILLVLISYYIMNFAGIDNKFAKIYKDNKLLYTINLSEVKDSYEIKIEDEEHFNIVRVERGGISIVKASCKDGVCKRCGIIRNGVIPIVCLPNNLIIEIVRENEEVELDGKTF